jgi:hypothetical protein
MDEIRCSDVDSDNLMEEEFLSLRQRKILLLILIVSSLSVLVFVLDKQPFFVSIMFRLCMVPSIALISVHILKSQDDQLQKSKIEMGEDLMAPFLDQSTAAAGYSPNGKPVAFSRRSITVNGITVV